MLRKKLEEEIISSFLPRYQEGLVITKDSTT